MGRSRGRARDREKASRESARIRQAHRRESLTPVQQQTERTATRQRMAQPAAKETTRKRLATPATKESTRKRMATPSAKESTRKRLATPAAKQSTRKRMATPAAKESTRKRMATPAACHMTLARKTESRRCQSTINVQLSLGEQRICPHCGSVVWRDESSICCSNGNHVIWPLPAPPKELLYWKGDPALDPWRRPRDSPQVRLQWNDRKTAPVPADGQFGGCYADRGFSAASRRINNHFAFTSIGTDTGDVEHAKTKPDGFVRLAGRVYHYIRSPSDDRTNIQYYINDSLPSAAEKGDTKWIKPIHAALMQNHPLAKTLRAARTVAAENVVVVPDPVTPVPACPQELAARFVIKDDASDAPSRNFIVFKNDGTERFYPHLNDKHYECLQFPILMPHGTTGL